jgi:hypothetical protein
MFEGDTSNTGTGNFTLTSIFSELFQRFISQGLTLLRKEYGCEAINGLRDAVK